METKIINLPLKTIAGIKNSSGVWDLPHTWEALTTQLEEKNIVDSVSNFMTLLYHDETTKKHTYQFASFEVNTHSDNYYGFEKITIEDGLYAVTVHYGSCEEIGPVWDKWTESWLGSSGWNRDYNRPNIEWYVNSTGLPTEMQLTYLCTPVKR